MVAGKWVGSGQQIGMRIHTREDCQIELARALVNRMVCEYTAGTYANKTGTKLEPKEHAKEGRERNSKEFKRIRNNRLRNRTLRNKTLGMGHF